MYGLDATLPALTVQQVLSVEYLRGLYTTGDTGSPMLPPLLVMIFARLVVVACILLAARLLTGLLRRLVHRGFAALLAKQTGHQRRLQTLEGLIASALAYVVYIIAIVPILFTIGLTWKALAGLLATSSVVLVAIGLGSQKLVRDLVNGLFILGEGQFDVGDWVTIGAVTGQVEEIGLRITRLRDEMGRVFIIANGDINQVFNASLGTVRLTIDVVLQRAGLDRALDTLRAAAAAALEAHDITPDERNLTLAIAGSDSAKVTVRLALWARQAQLASLEDDIRRRLLDAQEAEQLALV